MNPDDFISFFCLRLCIYVFLTYLFNNTQLEPKYDTDCENNHKANTHQGVVKNPIPTQCRCLASVSCCGVPGVYRVGKPLEHRE
jgi:hypothetical protein